MKKVLALIMALVMMIPLASIAFAAETTLTTSVPEATYTLTVPANQSIEYGAEYTPIAAPAVTDAAGFSESKNLVVDVAYDSFKSEKADTVIPFTVLFSDSEDFVAGYVGKELVFLGKADGTVSSAFANSCVYISAENWSKALPGDYTATITYTAQVVTEK